jgi:hypothetical protein
MPLHNYKLHYFPLHSPQPIDEQPHITDGIGCSSIRRKRTSFIQIPRQQTARTARLSPAEERFTNRYTNPMLLTSKLEEYSL